MKVQPIYGRTTSIAPHGELTCISRGLVFTSTRVLREIPHKKKLTHGVLPSTNTSGPAEVFLKRLLLGFVGRH